MTLRGSQYRSASDAISPNRGETLLLPGSSAPCNSRSLDLIQYLVEDDRVMRGPVRIEGIPRDRPRGGPSETPIQVLCRVSPLRVECQEAIPGAPRRILDGLH